ncbi:zinc finger, CCHC-type containing protein [Tanacetum coccineum]
MASKNLMQMSTDISKLDRFDGGSFKCWQEKMQFLLVTLNVAYVLTKPYPKDSEMKPWLNLVNVSSSEMTISSVVAISSMLCQIHYLMYIKSIPWLGIFGILSRNDTSRKTQQDDLSLKDLGKHLLIEEQYRLENKANDDTSKVHVVEEKGESSKAGGKKRRHDDKDKKKSKKNKKDVICYNCKKPGHFKRECGALKKKQDGGNDNKNKDNSFVAMISETFSLEEEKYWWVDS